MIFIGATDPKSVVEPRVVSLLAREFADTPVEVYLQYKGLVPGRRFVVDFYLPSCQIVIELQGGVFLEKSAHVGKGLVADYERAMLLYQNGVQSVIFVTPDNINMGLVRCLRQLIFK